LFEPDERGWAGASLPRPIAFLISSAPVQSRRPIRRGRV